MSRLFGRVSLALLSVTCLISAASAIDLTPTVEEYSHAGLQYRRLIFKEGKGTVALVPPQGWTVRGSKDRLQLTPPGKSFAEGAIIAAPLEPITFDEPTVRALQHQVVASAPPAAKSVQLLTREENPLAIGSNPTCQIAISYELLGEVFYRSVTYASTAESRVAFQFTAPKKEFDVLNGAFRQSINFWQFTETKQPWP